MAIVNVDHFCQVGSMNIFLGDGLTWVNISNILTPLPSGILLATLLEESNHNHGEVKMSITQPTRGPSKKLCVGYKKERRKSIFLYQTLPNERSLKGNDIDFKHIFFISTWVWDNLIEKYEMASWTPSPICNGFPLRSTCNLLDCP